MDRIKQIEHQLDVEKTAILDRMPNPDVLAEWCTREYEYVEVLAEYIHIHWGFNKTRARVMGAYATYNAGNIYVGIYCGTECIDQELARVNRVPRIATTLREVINAIDDILHILDKKYTNDCIVFNEKE